MKKSIEEIKERLTIRRKPQLLQDRDFLSTGSTLLNLACTGKKSCGFAKGFYYFLVGDSSSGKTFLSMTCLAEAAKNKNFDGYEFIYDNAEDGMLMDVEAFFGKKVQKRLRNPKPHCSTTVEEFYFNLDTALSKGPCIYILDSMDALDTEEEADKFKERKKARNSNREVSGNYGTSKAKANSSGIRRVRPMLQETGSILTVISQTRDNIGFGAKFNPKTRSGGHALRFYATLEMWSSIKGKIKTRLAGKDHQQGIVAEIKVKKNRMNGKERSVLIPIYPEAGIDEVGSCVDYLVECEHWQTEGKEGAGKIIASDFDLSLKRESLIGKIEEDGLESELQNIVAGVWLEIEEAIAIKRKPRYT